MEHQTIEHRLARLERANRRWALAASLAACALGVGAWTAQAPATLAARKFELKDGEGRVRADLALAEGGPMLTFRDAAGAERAQLFVDGDVVALYLKDAQGQPRVGAAHFGAVSGLALHGPEGKGTAVMSLRNGKDPSVRFYDESGKIVREIVGEGKEEK